MKYNKRKHDQYHTKKLLGKNRMILQNQWNENSNETTAQEMWIQTHNVRDFLTSGYKITPDFLTRHENQ